MREEIAAAVVFLTRLVKKNEKLSPEQVENFSNRLTSLLLEKFRDHWYNEAPNRGQGYRCIRVNSTGPQEPLLVRAAEDSGLQYTDLNMPTEMTLWVDPLEVCCRFGEYKGSYCTVAAFKAGRYDNRATIVDFENAIRKHELRTATAATSSQPPSAKTGLHKKHHANMTGTDYGGATTHFNVNAKPFKSQLSEGAGPGLYMYMATKSAVHWARGSHLGKA